MAFVLTPLIAAFAFACWQPLYGGLPSLLDRIFLSTKIYAVFGAYPPAVVLGLPALLILRTRVKATLRNCGYVGLIVAVVPWLTLHQLSRVDYAYSNGHVTAQDGVTTLWGWIEFFRFVGIIGLAGMFAGFVFWMIAVAGAKQATQGPA